MRVFRLHRCNREIQTLNKKYRTVDTDIGYIETLMLNDGHLSADPYPNLQYRRNDDPVRVLKARVLVPQLGGKSSGLRLIYEVLDVSGVRCCVLLHTYLHAQDVKENEVRKTILARIDSYETSLESIRTVALEILE